MDNQLLKRAILHHGRLLASFLEETEGFKSVKEDSRLMDSLKDVPRRHGSTLALKQFIAQNASTLFAKVLPDEKHSVEGVKCVSAFGLTPPLEFFLSVSPEDRLAHFFETVDVNDLVICRVRSKRNPESTHLYVESFALNQKSRLIDDLFIKAYCSLEEMPSKVVLTPGTRVLAYVLDINRSPESLIVGMNPPPDLFKGLTFGPILSSNSSQVDLTYRCTQEVQSKKTSYPACLKDSSGFKNPSNVEYLAKELGLSFKCSSLCSSFQSDVKPSELASALRAKQAHKWAFKSVESGIKYIKSGDNIEAFQCLNQAINIDPRNVEGLVARGALFANIGNYGKAVVDFEKALTEVPAHKNAKKYIIETLFALGKEQESKEKSGDPLDTYTKILSYDPENPLAVESISRIQQASATAQSKSKSDEEYDDSVMSFLERTQCPSDRKKRRPFSNSLHSKQRRASSSSDTSSPSSLSSSKQASKLSNPHRYPYNMQRKNCNGGERLVTEETISEDAKSSFLSKERTRNLSDNESDSSRCRNRSSRSRSTSSSRYSRKKERHSRKKRKHSRSPSRRRRSKHKKQHRKKSRTRDKKRRSRDKFSSGSLEKDLKGIQDETDRIEKEREDINERCMGLVRPTSKNSEHLSPNSIIPGQSNLEDVVAFVEQKRRDKMNILKKNYS